MSICLRRRFILGLILAVCAAGRGSWSGVKAVMPSPLSKRLSQCPRSSLGSTSGRSRSTTGSGETLTRRWGSCQVREPAAATLVLRGGSSDDGGGSGGLGGGGGGGEEAQAGEGGGGGEGEGEGREDEGGDGGGEGGIGDGGGGGEDEGEEGEEEDRGEGGGVEPQQEEVEEEEVTPQDEEAARVLLQEINDVMDERERSTAFAREARERLQAAMTSLEGVGSEANTTAGGRVTRSSSEEGRQWDGRAEALRHAIRGLEALSASVAGHGGVQQTSEFSRIAARHVQRVQRMRNGGDEGGRLLPYLRREGDVWRSWERRGEVFAPATRSFGSEEEMDEATACGGRVEDDSTLDGAGSMDFPVYPRRVRQRMAEIEREGFVDDEDYDDDFGVGTHGLGISAGNGNGVGGNSEATRRGSGTRQGHRLGTLRESGYGDALLGGSSLPVMGGGLSPGIGNGAIIVTVAFSAPGAPGGRHRVRLASSYQGSSERGRAAASRILRRIGTLLGVPPDVDVEGGMLSGDLGAGRAGDEEEDLEEEEGAIRWAEGLRERLFSSEIFGERTGGQNSGRDGPRDRDEERDAFHRTQSFNPFIKGHTGRVRCTGRAGVGGMFGVHQEPYVHSKRGLPRAPRVISCTRPGRAEYNRAIGRVLDQEARGLVGGAQGRGENEGVQEAAEEAQGVVGVARGQQGAVEGVPDAA